ncbi:MAG: hypothetical protein ACE5IK_02995 [Acidobacteriota bacterium]
MAPSKLAAAVEVRDLPRDVRDAIDMYMPRGIPPLSAHYYVQAEYVRLVRSRAQAERNAERWSRYVDELSDKLPNLSVKDVTNYVGDNCYQVDILLHPGLDLPDDPADLLGTLRRGVRIASIYASFLAPAWWMGVQKIVRVGSRGSRRSWESPQRSPAQKVRLVADEVLGTLGWLRLSTEQVRQKIADLSVHGKTPGESRVGHVLFSNNLDFS